VNEYEIFIAAHIISVLIFAAAQQVLFFGLFAPRKAKDKT
jgi:hypothetical protein